MKDILIHLLGLDRERIALLAELNGETSRRIQAYDLYRTTKSLLDKARGEIRQKDAELAYYKTENGKLLDELKTKDNG